MFFSAPQKSFLGKDQLLHDWRPGLATSYLITAALPPKARGPSDWQNGQGGFHCCLAGGIFSEAVFGRCLKRIYVLASEEFHAMKKVRISEKALVIIVIWMQKRENLEYVSHTLRKTNIAGWKIPFCLVFMWKHGEGI